jgi:sterol desaturase/sphingolipid hydroxylase (fatty acid hydroxylase superfamily)
MDDALYGERNARGHWMPYRRAQVGPLFDWPTRPKAIVRWMVGFPGYLWPWNLIYFGVAAAAWFWLTPEVASMRSFEPGWIGLILLRNLALVGIWVGGFHARLYLKCSQDIRFKYNNRWPSARSEQFTFNSQLRDNVLWTLASGVPIWTAYEAVTWWMFANGHIPWLEWATNPVWFVAQLLLVPMYREVHFYWLHRAIHWPPVYGIVHALHHRNTNPTPWSGLSMHPLEHLIYFSGVLLHWVIPSHPLHAMFHLMHAGLAPAPGHTGFDKIEVGGTRALDTSGPAHYLHHKYFEVNYSDGMIPFDKWFGSFHDGSPEAHARMQQRRAAQRRASTASQVLEN